MATITFYPLGNADSYRIDLPGGEKLLFDYANMRCADKDDDKRADLPEELRKDLKATSRDDFDVVAFTHLDNDHCCGAADFFYFDHSATHQSSSRIKIQEMWVPALAITEPEEDLSEDGRIIQAEARYRLKNGKGVRVFSRPEALKSWLEKNGLTVEKRKDMITDAGQPVPGWALDKQGVEFFVHSPFASRQDDGMLNDRNSSSLVFQAVFRSEGTDTRVLLMADTEYECMTEMVKVTKRHEREERLEWDLIKLPHHCSYLSLGPDKGKDITVPVEEVAWLLEKQGHVGSRVISTSDPIPTSGDQDQPPHRQAANYYKDLMAKTHSGEFLVTMEHPTAAAPAALVAQIDSFGVTVAKRSVPTGGGPTGQPAPRAGTAGTRSPTE